MIIAELDVMSGMPNPTWTLNENEIAEVFRMIPTSLPFVVPAEVVESKLGYRGTVLRASGAEAQMLAKLGLPPAIRVVADLVSGNSDLASQLAILPSLDDQIGGEDSEPAIGELDSMDSRQKPAAAGTCSLAYTSWNTFTFWNGTRKRKNNCYNYAANYASNTDFPGDDARDGKAHPGRISGNPMPYDPSDDQMWDALRSDGWTKSCNGTSFKIYAVTGDVIVQVDGQLYALKDYHFYRKSINGSNQNRWCHKPGHTAATNKDAAGDYITDPADADRSGSGFNYHHKVGVFYSPPFGPTDPRRVKVK